MAELDEHPAADLAIETSIDNAHTPLVSLSGELDSSNVHMLQDALDPLLAGGPPRLIFDVGGLRFMDSAGIAVLVTAAANGADLWLRKPSRIVRRIVEVTGLTEVLRIEP